jgi:hypothetical protein
MAAKTPPLVLREDPLPQFMVERDWYPWKDKPSLILEQPEAAEVSGPLYKMRTTQNKEVKVWKVDAISVSKRLKGGAVPANLRYYCHGWGLQTFDINANVGYTVTSDTCHRVLLDPGLFVQISSFPTKLNDDIVLRPKPGHESDLVNGRKGTFGSVWGIDSYKASYDIEKGDVIAWLRPRDGAVQQFGFLNASANALDAGIICGHTAIIDEPHIKEVPPTGSGIIALDWSTYMSSKNGSKPFKKATLTVIGESYAEYHYWVVFRRKQLQGIWS